MATQDLSYVLGWFEYEPEICLSEDVEWGYFKLIDTEQKAREYNYHSDYWGDAESYQEENVDLMGALEPYVGKAVTFRDYIDGEFTLLGIAIDRQYNSVSHTCIVVRENGRDAKRAFIAGYMAGSVKKATVEWNQLRYDEFPFGDDPDEAPLEAYWCRLDDGNYLIISPMVYAPVGGEYVPSDWAWTVDSVPPEVGMRDERQVYEMVDSGSGNGYFKPEDALAEFNEAYPNDRAAFRRSRKVGGDFYDKLFDEGDKVYDILFGYDADGRRYKIEIWESAEPGTWGQANFNYSIVDADDWSADYVGYGDYIMKMDKLWELLDDDLLKNGIVLGA